MIIGDIDGKVNFYFAQADGSNIPYGNLNETEVPWGFSYQEVEDIYAVGGFTIGDIKQANDYFHSPFLSSDIGKELVLEFYVDDKLIETSKRTINDDGFVVFGTDLAQSIPTFYLDQQINANEQKASLLRRKYFERIELFDLHFFEQVYTWHCFVF